MCPKKLYYLYRIYNQYYWQFFFKCKEFRQNIYIFSFLNYSQIKLEIPTYKKNDLPIELKKIPITKPGSRYLK